ncbi:indole-3-glycerol phosphate synthase TrpC [Alicyclobacillus sp. SO9]|uniref:indole-3-glycerol phosphate synthase TrpC n=1 Tax=Alicyclobacillus sp. SO9 TaxID=2665646 RepID=UPI0018E82E34|nr:indole-3-glycerol phosphate synthase TrpC [Alicyclobacillus sp. SO9]QQE76799.1 indole-3-glycerol phosphate synthase TrpC [Alicyclobacillus sp. SO9]
MSEFLSKILETKQIEVDALRHRKELMEPAVRTSQAGFAASIRTGAQLSIVAEVKKASPSKGLIQPNFNPVATATLYEAYGAAAISVLTDEQYFQGSIEDLAAVREQVKAPILRKDFIIDEVQIHEAVAAGADAVLLICAALPGDRLHELADHAKDCGLDVLIEVHREGELEAAVSAGPSVLGINNRDLKSFHVDLGVTEQVMKLVPSDLPVIAESGIKTPDDAKRMAAAGVDGLLVGESLMRQAASDRQLKDLFASLQQPRQSQLSARTDGVQR